MCLSACVCIQLQLQRLQVVAKGMIARGKGGSIVNLSSIGGRIVVQNAPSYTATKGAIEMLTKVMTNELGPHQVRQQTFQVEYTYLFKNINIVYMRDYY